MGINVKRRDFLAGGATAGLLLALPGCESLPRYSLTEAIRRLLTLASRNAFAMLLQPGGFYDSQIAHIYLPPQLGGQGAGSILAAILTSSGFRKRLERQLNRAAEKGAERASPLVADAIRTLSPEDAAAIIRGGPTAATDLLQGRMGMTLVEAMVPGIGEGMRLFDDGVIGQALSVATGIDFAGLARDISTKADRAIWSSIATEETKIRDNPQATGDPLLIAVLTGAGAF